MIFVTVSDYEATRKKIPKSSISTRPSICLRVFFLVSITALLKQYSEFKFKCLKPKTSSQQPSPERMMDKTLPNLKKLQNQLQNHHTVNWVETIHAGVGAARNISVVI